jgi:GT2 family glycosyltransferase
MLVNWNTRDMTLECLRSIYAETTETHFEVIVVDNGSHDGSAEMIGREFPQVRLMAEPVNHGFAHATNLQAAHARGEKLLLLNTDTVVLGGAIDQLLAFSRRRPEAKIWGGRTLFADGTLNPSSCWGKMTPWSLFCSAMCLTALFPQNALFNPISYGNWQRDDEREVDVVTGCLFMIKRDFWRELDGFDPAFFMYGEEADLCARARARGARPMITPLATIVHYDGGSSSSRAGKLIYLYGAMVGLIDRHFSPFWRTPSRWLLFLAVVNRSACYSIVGWLNRSAAQIASGKEWTAVWKRRAEWQNGPRSSAVDY